MRREYKTYQKTRMQSGWFRTRLMFKEHTYRIYESKPNNGYITIYTTTYILPFSFDKMDSKVKVLEHDTEDVSWSYDNEEQKQNYLHFLKDIGAREKESK